MFLKTTSQLCFWKGSYSLKETLTISSLSLHYLGHIVPHLPDSTLACLLPTISSLLQSILSEASDLILGQCSEHFIFYILKPLLQTLLIPHYQFSEANRTEPSRWTPTCTVSIHTNSWAMATIPSDALFLGYYNVLLTWKGSMIIHLANCLLMKWG